MDKNWGKNNRSALERIEKNIETTSDTKRTKRNKEENERKGQLGGKLKIMNQIYG